VKEKFVYVDFLLYLYGMIKSLLTIIAFTCVIGSIGLNIFYKDENARKYKLVAGFLYVATFLLFVANGMTLED